MIAVTVRSARAMRTARSTTCVAWRGSLTSARYSLATSLYSERRSTSCWKSPPSDIRFC